MSSLLLTKIVAVTVLLVGSISAKDVAPDEQNGWKRVDKNIPLPGVWGRTISEGLTHDDVHWYLNSKKVLYKATKNNLEKVAENKHAIPSELADQKYGHIGDIDCFDGVLYGGIEISKSEPGVIASWNASDLTLLQFQVTGQNGMPWVAADGAAGLLYSTHWSDTGRINVFDMATFEQRDDLTIFPLSSAADDQFPPEIQGAAFYDKDPGFLYLAVNGAESVHKVNVATGELHFVLSDEQYKTHEAEMEVRVYLYLHQFLGLLLGLLLGWSAPVSVHVYVCVSHRH